MLETMRVSSPDIEVRVRFFAGKIQPSELSFTSLKGEKVIDEIMDQFPKPDGDGTCYMQATSETCDVLIPQKNKQQVYGSRLDWLLFVLLTDGEDIVGLGGSSGVYREGGGNDWTVKLEQLRKSIPEGAMTGVIAVGVAALPILILY